MKTCFRFIDKTVATVLLMLSPLMANAALPTPVPPSGGAGSGDWFGLIRGYLQDEPRKIKPLRGDYRH